MINGTIQTIHPITEFESKGGEKFTKQIFTVVNSEGYEGKEQLFAFELFGDKTSLLNGFKVGDEVNVEYNLSCRHWKEDRYFISLQAWKIEKGEGYQKPEAQNHNTQPQTAPALPESDSLPF